jgi:hypothetical protein
MGPKRSMMSRRQTGQDFGAKWQLPARCFEHTLGLANDLRGRESAITLIDCDSCAAISGPG